MKVSFLLEMIEEFDFFVVQAGLVIRHYLYLHGTKKNILFDRLFRPPLRQSTLVECLPFHHDGLGKLQKP